MTAVRLLSAILMLCLPAGIGQAQTEPVRAPQLAIINAMLAAKTMTGVDYLRVRALPHPRLKAVLQKYNRVRVRSEK